VNHISHGRNLSDIHFTAEPTQEQVVTIWDSQMGIAVSGVAYVEYTLQDAPRSVDITFLPDFPASLNWAFLFPA